MDPLKELLSGDLGPNAKYDLKIEDGKLKASVSFVKNSVEAELSVNLSPALLLDLLKAKIPGTIDDLIIDLLKKSLGL